MNLTMCKLSISPILTSEIKPIKHLTEPIVYGKVSEMTGAELVEND